MLDNCLDPIMQTHTHTHTRAESQGDRSKYREEKHKSCTANRSIFWAFLLNCALVINSTNYRCVQYFVGIDVLLDYLVSRLLVTAAGMHRSM